MEKTNIIDKRVSNNLRYWRKIRGLTRQELADKIGVTTKTIYNYENARTHIKKNNTDRICSALNISREQLYIFLNVEDNPIDNNKIFDTNETESKEETPPEQAFFDYIEVRKTISATHLLYFLGTIYDIFLYYKTPGRKNEIDYIDVYQVVSFNLNSNYATIISEYNLPTKVELTHVTLEDVSLGKNMNALADTLVDALFNDIIEIPSIKDAVKDKISDHKYQYSRTIKIDDFRLKLSSIKNYIEYIFFQDN